jgi:hypothetical protein
MNTSQRLIEARDRMVKDYGTIIPVREMTEKVSPFPGGTGFLAGEPGDRDYMFLLNNYSGGDTLHRRENYRSAFWETLCTYLNGAAIGREEVFLTNYYMGAKPGKSNGDIVSFGGELFGKECRGFFLEQVRLTNPKIIVACGGEVWPALADLDEPPKLYVAHPSSNRDPNKREHQAAQWIQAIRMAKQRLGLA